MRKITLLIASLFITIGAMAQKIVDFYDVSTTFSIYGGNNEDNIIDGNYNSKFWSGEAQAVDKEVKITLNSPQTVETIKWYFCSGDKPKKAVIERCEADNEEWIKIADLTDSQIDGDNLYTCNVGGNTIKKLRLRITEAHSNWLQIAEVELFAPIIEREISVNALEGGTVNIEGIDATTITTSEVVTLVATPNNGYAFKHWQIGDEIVSTKNIYKDEESTSKQYTAVFAKVPEWSKGVFRFKSKGTGNYLTIKKYNSSEEQSYQTSEKEESDDQKFILEPAIHYNYYYIKSLSGYYMNCASWNAYAQNNSTTPILFTEESEGIYTLYQETSSHKHGYMNIQTTNNNGLYCDAQSVNDYSRWIIESLTTSKSDLQELIKECTDLLNTVTCDAIEKGDTEIDLTGKISSNADHNDGTAAKDGDGVNALLDSLYSTYFHSRWGGGEVNEPHYLQIDLGENGALSNFVFEYAIRDSGNPNQNSPAPTRIEVRVSEDGEDFGEPITTLTAAENRLPAYSQTPVELWTSDIISSNKEIRYIRFIVTESNGPGDKQYGGQYFFGLGTLNLYPTKRIEYGNIKDEYKEKVTNELVHDAVNSLKTITDTETEYVYKEDAEALTAAYKALKFTAFPYTLIVSEVGYATLFLDYDAAIPDFEGEENGVYIATGENSHGYMNLEKVTGVLPENTGVIVKANEGKYTFVYSTDTPADVSYNLLRGSVNNKYVEGKAFVLGIPDGETRPALCVAELNMNENGEPGDTHFLNNANKAYLPAPENAEGVKSYSFRFDFGGTTGVEEVEVENDVKVIYDLTGRRVNEIAEKGIYIVNGNKVLVK